MVLKIAVSMITLNEEAYIRQALESCSFADEIFVTDGFSEDGTVAAFKDFDVTYEHAEWPNDFSAQRNRSLALIPADFDWWMRLDADEVYSENLMQSIRYLLERVPPEYYGLRVRQVNLVKDEYTYSAGRGGWETWPRIFRNIRLKDGRPAWHWLGQVHEHPVMITDRGYTEALCLNYNVPVIHYGWLSQERREEREQQYLGIEGSGFKKGALVNRIHAERSVPHQFDL